MIVSHKEWYFKYVSHNFEIIQFFQGKEYYS